MRSIQLIDKLIGEIEQHPEYSPMLRKQQMHVRQQQAAKHSTLMEREGESVSKKACERAKRESTMNLDETWDYLHEEGITPVTLAALPRLIEPKKNTAGLRSEHVRFGGIYGSDPGAIPSELENLAYRLSLENVHPVLRATEGHLEYVKIHPGVDGNGRAARLLQNFVLDRDSYPAALISVSDTHVYRGLIKGALLERLNREGSFETPGERETLFRDFIAGKVLESAYSLRRTLERERSYDITFTKRTSPNLLHSAAQVLRHGTDSPDNNIRVHVYRDQRALCLQGDLSRYDVLNILEPLARKHGLHYQVKSRENPC